MCGHTCEFHDGQVIYGLTFSFKCSSKSPIHSISDTQQKRGFMDYAEVEEAESSDDHGNLGTNSGEYSYDHGYQNTQHY